MAVYGVNTTTGVARGGVIPFTGWSPSLGTTDAVSGSAAGAVQYNGLMQQDYSIIYNLARGSNRAALAILKSITGAAAGGAISSTYKRVTGTVPPTGGAQPIETVTLASRTSTAADVTAFTALLNRLVNPTTYALDLSGNGGGGKLSYQGIS